MLLMTNQNLEVFVWAVIGVRALAFFNLLSASPASIILLPALGWSVQGRLEGWSTQNMTLSLFTSCCLSQPEYYRLFTEKTGICKLRYVFHTACKSKRSLFGINWGSRTQRQLSWLPTNQHSQRKRCQWKKIRKCNMSAQLDYINSLKTHI